MMVYMNDDDDDKWNYYKYLQRNEKLQKLYNKPRKYKHCGPTNCFANWIPE